jgi:hypothetical protein
MKVEEGQVGQKYLTLQGIPITILKVLPSKVMLKSEATKNELEVKHGYPIREYQEDQIEPESKALIFSVKASLRPQGRALAGATRRLSMVIDEYLLTGNYTPKSILERIQGIPEAEGYGNLLANVHARCTVHKRKGDTIQKDKEGKILLTLRKSKC